MGKRLESIKLDILARAGGADAASAAVRKARATIWTALDYQIACQTYDRIMADALDGID